MPEVCDNCWTDFEMLPEDGSFMGNPNGELSCSPHTAFVTWCPECAKNLFKEISKHEQETVH